MLAGGTAMPRRSRSRARSRSPTRSRKPSGWTRKHTAMAAGAGTLATGVGIGGALLHKYFSKPTADKIEEVAKTVLGVNNKGKNGNAVNKPQTEALLNTQGSPAEQVAVAANLAGQGVQLHPAPVQAAGDQVIEQVARNANMTPESTTMLQQVARNAGGQQTGEVASALGQQEGLPEDHRENVVQAAAQVAHVNEAVANATGGVTRKKKQSAKEYNAAVQAKLLNNLPPRRR